MANEDDQRTAKVEKGLKTGGASSGTYGQQNSGGRHNQGATKDRAEKDRDPPIQKDD